MSLSFQDEIVVSGVETNRTVQLYYGSVTKLQRNEEVDVLLISAYPGDYLPTPRSVIGALHNDLNISLKDLSKNKEEDLRNTLSCWWSKELAAGFPFRRILCFEGAYKHGKTPPEVTGDVFRALISLCCGTDVSVIMPLLATGYQGYSKILMMTLLVETALHWMKIGSPLKVLKLVVFGNDATPELLQSFHDLKRKWKEQCKISQQITASKHDLYLCYSQIDTDVAIDFQTQLKKYDSTINVLCHEANNSTHERNDAFDELVYMNMISCSRVLVLLSPGFLSDPRCLDLFNMAQCCSRRMKRDYLLPLYITDTHTLPIYMSTIQYIDCTSRDFDLLCQTVVQWLKENKPMIKERENRKLGTELQNILHDNSNGKNRYDVFLSYSHQDNDTAEQIIHGLKKFNPKLKIFYDVTGLNTGCFWQMNLFEALGNRS